MTPELQALLDQVTVTAAAESKCVETLKAQPDNAAFKATITAITAQLKTSSDALSVALATV